MIRIAAGAAFQDFGRSGYRCFGVPPSGAFDRTSLAFANKLLGNRQDAAALEIPLMGGEFVATADLAIAVAGAECELEVDGRTLACNGRLVVSAGGRLRLGPARRGVRVYIAVPGGFAARKVLGSSAGLSVSKDEVLTPVSEDGPAAHARLREAPATLFQRKFRFLPGPQRDLFNLEAFCSQSFKVALDSDRRGIRLHGSLKGAVDEIVSEPTCLGCIQVTPSGTVIVLGPDGPTIGGYPKIGVVVDEELDSLGQLSPGADISFEAIGYANTHGPT